MRGRREILPKTKYPSVLFWITLVMCLFWWARKVGVNKQQFSDSQGSTSEIPSAEGSNGTANLSYEVYPLVGMGPVRFGLLKEDVIKELGEPAEVEGGGLSFLYLSKGFSLMVSLEKGVQHFNFYTRKAAPPFMQVNDFSGTTKEGISMGASRSKIIAAYGEPNSEQKSGRQVRMEYNHLGMTFILLRDKLVQFFMFAPRPDEVVPFPSEADD